MNETILWGSDLIADWDVVRAKKNNAITIELNDDIRNYEYIKIYYTRYDYTDLEIVWYSITTPDEFILSNVNERCPRPSIYYQHNSSYGWGRSLRLTDVTTYTTIAVSATFRAGSSGDNWAGILPFKITGLS